MPYNMTCQLIWHDIGYDIEHDIGHDIVHEIRPDIDMRLDMTLFVSVPNLCSRFQLFDITIGYETIAHGECSLSQG